MNTYADWEGEIYCKNHIPKRQAMGGMERADMQAAKNAPKVAVVNNEKLAGDSGKGTVSVDDIALSPRYAPKPDVVKSNVRLEGDTSHSHGADSITHQQATNAPKPNVVKSNVHLEGDTSHSHGADSITHQQATNAPKLETSNQQIRPGGQHSNTGQVG